MAGLTMLVLALLDRYSGCFLLSYSRNVRNLKTVVSIFTLIWCKNQRCMTFADCRPQTADRRPQTADCRPQTADCRLQTADCRLQTADHRLQVVN